jgi:hypothetical protein
MVSPFTRDSKALQPKRLRSFPGPQAQVAPWIVGCGYGAIAYLNDRALVVRLSDGWSWEIFAPNVADAGPTQVWRFGTVYGITCDEVFLRGGVGSEMNIARVRLDALGAGQPPD